MAWFVLELFMTSCGRLYYCLQQRFAFFQRLDGTGIEVLALLFHPCSRWFIFLIGLEPLGHTNIVFANSGTLDSNRISAQACADRHRLGQRYVCCSHGLSSASRVLDPSRRHFHAKIVKFVNPSRARRGWWRRPHPMKMTPNAHGSSRRPMTDCRRIFPSNYGFLSSKQNRTTTLCTSTLAKSHRVTHLPPLLSAACPARIQAWTSRLQQRVRS